MTDVTAITYNPIHYLEKSHTMRPVDDVSAPHDPDNYASVDAIFHYFEEHDIGEEVAGAEADPNAKLSQVAAICMLISEQFSSPFERGINYASYEVEPDWHRFRQSTSFIAGGFTENFMAKIKRTLPYHMSRDTVFLDGSNYADEHGVGEELDAFNRLMLLASNTKTVIEDALATEYAHDARGAIKFLNAAATDEIDPPAGSTFSGCAPTKWYEEARYLSRELVSIHEFRKNFNTLVIYGAHRFLVSNQLNVTKLYRLMAKLGRVNTRIVFVG